MNEGIRRSTVYLETDLHKALKIKAIHAHKTVSEIINEAIKLSLKEDLEDLAAFDERAAEPVISYEKLLAGLKADGKI